MTHYMKLHKGPFDKIRNGQKNIELRLYDEKRRRIVAGDTIVFSCGSERVTAQVAAMHCFSSFAELYKNLPLLQCGYTHEDIHTADPADMDLYYSREQQAKYGVVGIELCRVQPLSLQDQSKRR